MAVTKVKRKFRSATLQYTYDRYIGHDPKLVEEYEEEVINADIARKIYDLRTKAGLSQRQLAKKIGTTASVICRLEDADYDGHSLSMLKRIAEALDKRVEIRFVPVRRLRTA
jgi:ribosome-binding protein aMBF1 (putative translation factor)